MKLDRLFRGIYSRRDARALYAAGQSERRRREAEREDLEARHPGAPSKAANRRARRRGER